MRRTLLPSAAFTRAARKIAKRSAAAATDIQTALERLAADAFDPRLKTHKLSGELATSWACSAGRDLRIIFSFVQHEGAEVVLLESAGSHDEVY